jgi:hypothetical protein
MIKSASYLHVRWCGKSRGGTAYQSVNNVPSVRIMARVTALTPDEIHNFVLPLARHTRVGNDDLNLLKVGKRAVPSTERKTPTFFQPGSLLSFWTTQYRSEEASNVIKGVPGVMALESQGVLALSSSVTVLPMAT